MYGGLCGVGLRKLFDLSWMFTSLVFKYHIQNTYFLFVGDEIFCGEQRRNRSFFYVYIKGVIMSFERFVSGI